MMISYKAIGRRIKYYRKLAKMRQADLAEKLDVSISYISQLECGIAEVSLKRLDEIAVIISCKLQYLVADADDTEQDYLVSEINERICSLTKHEKLLLINLVEAVEKSREDE